LLKYRNQLLLQGRILVSSLSISVQYELQRWTAHEFILVNYLSNHCSKENSYVKGELINITRVWNKQKEIWAPNSNWTHDLPNTRQMLYPLSYKNSWRASSFTIFIHLSENSQSLSMIEILFLKSFYCKRAIVLLMINNFLNYRVQLLLRNTFLIPFLFASLQTTIFQAWSRNLQKGTSQSFPNVDLIMHSFSNTQYEYIHVLMNKFDKQ